MYLYIINIYTYFYTYICTYIYTYIRLPPRHLDVPGLRCVLQKKEKKRKSCIFWARKFWTCLGRFVRCKACSFLLNYRIIVSVILIKLSHYCQRVWTTLCAVEKLWKTEPGHFTKYTFQHKIHIPCVSHSEFLNVSDIHNLLNVSWPILCTKHVVRHVSGYYYGMATISGLLKIIGLFCERAA